MIGHILPASQYAVNTDRDKASDIQDTYSYVYGEWLDASDYTEVGSDYEIWDTRYQPESSDNEVDHYIAIRPK